MTQQILEFNPFDCLAPPDNRAVDLEDITAMAASYQANHAIGAQLHPAIVCVHPELPDKLLILDGFIRNEACKITGRKLKAMKVERPLTKAEQAKLRLTANVFRKGMSPLEIANDVLLFMKETKCSQKEAAEKLGFTQATVSRYLTIRRLPPEVREQIEAGKLDFSAGYYLATLHTQEQMRDAAKKVVDGGLTKDQVIGLVESLKGKKEVKKNKTKKLILTFDLPPVAPAAALIERLKSLIARLQKVGDVPPDAIAPLLS